MFILGKGTQHIQMCSDVHTRGVGTPHIKMCSDVHNVRGGGTPHIKMWLDVHAAHENVLKYSYLGGDTAQISKKNYGTGGWVVDNYLKNNATSWLHLAGWNLPDFQLS